MALMVGVFCKKVSRKFTRFVHTAVWVVIPNTVENTELCKSFVDICWAHPVVNQMY